MVSKTKKQKVSDQRTSAQLANQLNRAIIEADVSTFEKMGVTMTTKNVTPVKSVEKIGPETSA